jgi:hypothetical protein
MEKHICIDCTLIKNHPDCNAYMDYLVDNHFVHSVENLPYGILPFAFPFANEDYIDYVFNKLSVQKIAVPDENDVLTDMAVLVNMDCTRVELLINADESRSLATAHSIARNALEKYLEEFDFDKSDDFVVFHLGEVLRDAYQENGEEHRLPSGWHYKVVDTPFHGDIISNILDNISIHRHEKKIEKVIMEALGITREQAKFDHVFSPDTRCDFQGFDQEYALDITYFDYRGKRLILFLTADEKGHQAIELSQTRNGARVNVNDIHDLKSAIDKNFFNDAPTEEAPKEAPKVEPVETPKEEPEAEPEEAPKVDADILVSIKANTYIEAFTKKQAEVISRTAKGEDWFAEFNEIASPKEVVGYYFYTYGILNALKCWKKNSDKSERTEFDEDVDEIFDSIFCPFCKQKKRVSFGSTEVSLQYQEDGKVHCYHKDEYTGTMDFPNCPQCGSKLD